MFAQVFARWAVRLNRSRGRNMIGGNAVSQNRQRPGPSDGRDARHLHAHAVKIRRAPHIGGIRIPRKPGPCTDRHCLPEIISAEHIGVARAEHLPGHVRINSSVDRLGLRPDVTQHNGLPLRIQTDRFGCKVNIGRPR